MELPIYIDGAQAGRLTVTEQGPVTVLEARMGDAGRLVRLTVFGGDEAFYLGVPVPAEGEMRLTRRATAAEMRRFPRHPEYAAERKTEIRPAPPRTRVLWLGGRPWYFR